MRQKIQRMNKKMTIYIHKTKKTAKKISKNKIKITLLPLSLYIFSYLQMSKGGFKYGLEEEKCRKEVTVPAVIKMTDVCSRWSVSRPVPALHLSVCKIDGHP